MLAASGPLLNIEARNQLAGRARVPRAWLLVWRWGCILHWNTSAKWCAVRYYTIGNILNQLWKLSCQGTHSILNSNAFNIKSLNNKAISHNALTTESGNSFPITSRFFYDLEMGITAFELLSSLTHSWVIRVRRLETKTWLLSIDGNYTYRKYTVAMEATWVLKPCRMATVACCTLLCT